jgi:tetratricopeptide (TPR) repeat protein
LNRISFELALVALLVGVFSMVHEGSRPNQEHYILPQLQTLAQLVAARSQIEKSDIASVNLLCSEGLPNADNLSLANSLAMLDQWASHIKSETERHLYRFKAAPAEYENSEGYFRMLMMAVVLHEDYGVRYNPQRITIPTATSPNDGFFSDSRDIFLHGLLGEKRLGTCSSMPVLYVALGRRLGYPLKLVTTKAHLFVRWEDARERFNLECTGRGMNRYDDEHYKHWPFEVTEEEIQEDGYLKSLTPSEELALFLSLRGNCLKEAGRMPEAIASYDQAVRFAPNARPYRVLLSATRNQSAGTVAAIPQPRAVVPIPTSHTLDPNPLTQLRNQPIYQPEGRP